MLASPVGLIALCVLASAADPDLPPEAARVVERRDLAVATARKSFDGSVEKADSEARKELAKLLIASTKKGDLVSANAIKAKIDAYAPNTDVLGDPAIPMSKAMIGNWKYTLAASAGILTVEASNATKLGNGFIGVIAYPDDKTGVITWSNGTKWTITASDGSFGVSASDGTSQLTRVK